MNFAPVCYACLLRQTEKAAEILGCDLEASHSLMREVSAALAAAPIPAPAPAIGEIVHKKIQEVSGVKDPYLKLKRKYNRIATDLSEKLKSETAPGGDKIAAAAKAAIAGNIIDFGAAIGFDLESNLKQVMSEPLFRDDYKLFREKLFSGAKILYLLDNAGEAAFDKSFIDLLISETGADVTAAVKSGPIINDMTLDDARDIGLDRICEVIETGLSMPGTDPEKSTAQFRELFDRANIVISKGQGNFETLDENRRDIFFLFQVKCAHVADLIGAPLFGAFFYYKPKGEKAFTTPKKSDR